jgi:isocitrate/isopropylmalate dehydrogenase
MGVVMYSVLRFAVLDWFGTRKGDDRLRGAARRLDSAVASTIASGVRTPDLGGSAATEQLADCVRHALGQADPHHPVNRRSVGP